MQFRALAHITLIVLSLLSCGCSTRSPSYDQDAIQSRARIVGKSVAGEQVQARADRPNMGASMAGVIGPAALPLGDALQGKTSVKVYAYRVKNEAGVEVTVLSEYPAFEVGDCVILFQSSQPTYPRIARGGGCA